MAAWWDILGIEQDADLRSIKRAYAGKLKALKNNNDPQAFMALREAYEQAVLYAQENIQVGETLSGGQLEPASISPIDTGQASHGFAVDSVPVGNIMEDVQALMEQPLGGADVAGWSAIFADERLVMIDGFIAFEQDMANWLAEMHSKYKAEVIKPKLSAEVSGLIFEMFCWQDKIHSLDVNADILRRLARILQPINMSEIDWLTTYEINKRDEEIALAALKEVHDEQDRFVSIQRVFTFIFVGIPGVVISILFTVSVLSWYFGW